MLFNRSIKSPVKQELMYLAEYADGKYQTEFDLTTQKPQSFYTVEKEKLIRFGLVGTDVPMYIETYGGYFHLAGRNIQVKYKEKDKEYYLIGHPRFYTNVHYYKTGVAVLPDSPRDLEFVAWDKIDEVKSFHFGYEESILLDDIRFKFYAECTIPFQSPVKMKFRIKTDREMEGNLIIIRNGQEIEKIPAPLDQDYGGEIEWVVI